ncbi:MAG: hypothetical protein GZ086_00935 [Gelidibacter sp.]|nr:hypothetical protein [Gelidibacter sp.]
MEKCIIDLICATTQITPVHFRAIGTRENHSQYDQNIEQSFSAELFHRFKSLIELPANTNYYNNLILHFDITKLSVGSRPDLVLHESQANRNNQKMFIEVKTDPKANLTDDFNKLIMSTAEYLNFQNSVLIVVNRSFEETHNLIKNHKEFYSIPNERKSRIFIINLYQGEDDLIDYNLYNIKYLYNKQ